MPKSEARAEPPKSTERYRVFLDTTRALTGTLSSDELFTAIHRETAHVLEAAGFADCRQSTVASGWQVSDPGAPYDFFRDGTARGGALLRPQPPENAAAIRAAVVAKVLEKHGKGPSWNVPIPAVVTVAVAV